MHPEGLALLRELTACHATFKALAAELRNTPGYGRVAHEFDLAQMPEGIRFSEYVSPERADARWAYWRMDVLLAADGGATARADALGVAPDGGNLHECFTPDALSAEAVAGGALAELARRVCGVASA